MRFNLILVTIILICSSTISTANPGGKEDDVRSRDCAGSCHSSPSTNGQSTADLQLVFPDKIYAGLLFDMTSSVSNVDVSSNNMIGHNLLVNAEGAKDIPSNDGWEIVTDPNGGTNNYVQVVDSFSTFNTVNSTWTLRAPSTAGMYELYLAVQHGSPQGGIAMTGISTPFEVEVLEVPENLPRLAPDWQPQNSRLIGESTTFSLETLFTDSATVELKNGGEITTLEVVDGEFTIPASVNEGVVEWRVIMEGEGPVQTSPWFRLTSTVPGWEVDEFSLYAQGFGLMLLFLGLVLSFRNTTPRENKDYTHEIQDLQAIVATDTTTEITGPPIPESGLPEGWTEEQWAYYGQEHLDSIQGGVE